MAKFHTPIRMKSCCYKRLPQFSYEFFKLLAFFQFWFSEATEVFWLHFSQKEGVEEEKACLMLASVLKTLQPKNRNTPNL